MKQDLKVLYNSESCFADMMYNRNSLENANFGLFSHSSKRVEKLAEKGKGADEMETGESR